MSNLADVPNHTIEREFSYSWDLDREERDYQAYANRRPPPPKTKPVEKSRWRFWLDFVDGKGTGDFVGLANQNLITLSWMAPADPATPLVHNKQAFHPNFPRVFSYFRNRPRKKPTRAARSPRTNPKDFDEEKCVDAVFACLRRLSAAGIDNASISSMVTAAGGPPAWLLSKWIRSRRSRNVFATWSHHGTMFISLRENWRSSHHA